MPDWDRLQRYVEHLYSTGKIPMTFSTAGENSPELVLHEVQNRTEKGYRIMESYDLYVTEAQKRGIAVEGY